MGRFYYSLWDEYVVFNCRRNSRTLFWLLIFFAAGILLGLVLGAKGLYTDLIFGDSVSYVILVINGQISFWEMVFRGIMISVQIFMLVFIFSLSVYLLPLQFLFVIYRGYILGAAAVVFTASLGISGFATVLILIIPQQSVLLVCVMLYIMLSSRCCLRLGRYGCKNIIGLQAQGCIFLFCLSLVNILVQVLLVYVIIRPFNLLI